MLKEEVGCWEDEGPAGRTEGDWRLETKAECQENGSFGDSSGSGLMSQDTGHEN